MIALWSAPKAFGGAAGQSLKAAAKLVGQVGSEPVS